MKEMSVSERRNEREELFVNDVWMKEMGVNVRPVWKWNKKLCVDAMSVTPPYVGPKQE